MRINRILLAAVLVVVALVIQVSVLARLQLPGAVPDLMLLVVLALALVWGPTGGCVTGFCAGLLADLAPPSDHAVGRYALVLCLLGYAAGLLKPPGGQIRSVLTPLALVAVAAFTATLLYAGVGALVGDTAARHVGLGGLIGTAVLYDVILAPFVVPGVMALARRVETDPVAQAADSGAGGPSGRSGGLAGRLFGAASFRRRERAMFGGEGTRTGGIAGLGTVPGFGKGRSGASGKRAGTSSSMVRPGKRL
ncbi:rod shape-determining protein MreD [Phaeacidiphilus oryzae]|uniref:rod shape-determining protein MreD n=1 Tax=Phaeacidiphilus oryzae TaxID=348818 RepID=UPI0006919546|nr:rod shape-determining protein MreD [Phaeacidiphilus oryzae]